MATDNFPYTLEHLLLTIPLSMPQNPGTRIECGIVNPVQEPFGCSSVQVNFKIMNDNETSSSGLVGQLSNECSAPFCLGRTVYQNEVIVGQVKLWQDAFDWLWHVADSEPRVVFRGRIDSRDPIGITLYRDNGSNVRKRRTIEEGQSAIESRTEFQDFRNPQRASKPHEYRNMSSVVNCVPWWKSAARYSPDYSEGSPKFREKQSSRIALVHSQAAIELESGLDLFCFRIETAFKPTWPNQESSLRAP